METITRYTIEECSGEFNLYRSKYRNVSKETYLYEGVVHEKAEPLEEEIKGIYSSKEEALEDFKKYVSDIYFFSHTFPYVDITEYYLSERTFDVSSAIENEPSVHSAEDFEKLLNKDFSFGYDYLEDESVLKVSPMLITVTVSVDENETSVLFHNYKEAKEFEYTISDMFSDNPELFEDWETDIDYPSTIQDTITEEEFYKWLNQIKK